LRRSQTNGDSPTAKRSAKKRPPERPCPRGAKDSNLFRERLVTLAFEARMLRERRSGRRRRVVSEAYRRHPCWRGALRGPQEGQSSDLPGADPSTWIARVRYQALRVAYSKCIVRVSRTRFHVVRRENRGITIWGQGRFSPGNRAIFSIKFVRDFALLRAANKNGEAGHETQPRQPLSARPSGNRGRSAAGR
jgi:hypothetical protein